MVYEKVQIFCANPRDTLDRQRIRAKEPMTNNSTIELRCDDDSLELFNQRVEWNQEIQAKCNVKRSGEWFYMVSWNLVPRDLVKLNSVD